MQENRLGEGSRLDVEGHLALAGSSNSGERSAFTQAVSNTSHSQTTNSRAQHICIVTETLLK